MSGDSGGLFDLMEPLRSPLIQEVIEWLDLPPGSRGLDVASGVGLEAVKLLRAVAPGGWVVAVDRSVPFLQAGKDGLPRSSPGALVRSSAGDWAALPFERASFDWVCSCDGVGYAPFVQESAFRELARVLRPGGRAALLFWSSQSLLPGYPRLEARLNATRAGIAPFEDGSPPELHAMRGLGWMRAAGFENVRVRTFVRTVQAPLDERAKAALAALLDMRWGGCEGELGLGDRAEFRRLSHPGSAEYILNSPDYCAFFTYTVFSGDAAGRPNN